MGYTHYWEFKSNKKLGFKKQEEIFQRAISKCVDLVKAYSEIDGGLSGYTAHAKKGVYGGLKVNGSMQNAHEDFIIRSHFIENIGMSFCKTARKPYDDVVTACLIILKHYLKDSIIISSDGEREDFDAGVNLVHGLLGIQVRYPLKSVCSKCNQSIEE